MFARIVCSGSNCNSANRTNLDLLYGIGCQRNISACDIRVQSNKSSEFTQLPPSSNASVLFHYIRVIFAHEQDNHLYFADTSEYSLEIFVTACLYWNHRNERWQHDGCRVCIALH